MERLERMSKAAEAAKAQAGGLARPVQYSNLHPAPLTTDSVLVNQTAKAQGKGKPAAAKAPPKASAGEDPEPPQGSKAAGRPAAAPKPTAALLDGVPGKEGKQKVHKAAALAGKAAAGAADVGAGVVDGGGGAKKLAKAKRTGKKRERPGHSVKKRAGKRQRAEVKAKKQAEAGPAGGKGGEPDT